MKKQDFKVLKTKDLYPFPDNPFHVAEDETLSELAESIKEFGIVTPIITRPKEDGNGYEVIAGQRRVRASELAGINTVPAFVLPLDRDRAIITLVDSNLQRENILPSERAFAYKMKSEAMKRQGFRTDLTSSQVVTKLRTDDKVAQGFGVGRMTVQRFIRLTELIPPILQMVDEGKIALTPAVELSFLKKDEQENLFATMESEEATPSLSQAQRMKQLSQSGRLDMDTIFAIMTEEKGNQKETLKINTSKLKKYFPKNTTPKQMEETIIKLLERELKNRKENKTMYYEQFKERIEEDLHQALADHGIDANLSQHHVEKLNASYDAISVTPEGSHIGVNANLSAMFEAIENG